MRGFLAKHWFVCSLPVAIGSAVLWPAAIRPVTEWTPHPQFPMPLFLMACSLFLVAWTMPTRWLVAEIRSPLASLWAVALSYGVLPLGGWLLGFLAASDVQIGLVLIASVPCTLASAILWTRMAGGNEATALLTVMGTTCMSWFLTTLWLYVLTGHSVPIDVQAMMRDLVLSLIVPVFVGQALRRVPLGRTFAERHKLLLAALAQALVVFIILKAGVAVGNKLHDADAWQSPMIFVWSLVLANGLHLGALAAGYFTCRWLGFDRGRQIAVAFSASQKTLQVSLVLYDQYFKDAFPFAVLPLLFYHVGQLLLDTIIAQKMTKNTTVAAPPDEEIQHYHI